jgi:hypothetical protein
MLSYFLKNHLQNPEKARDKNVKYCQRDQYFPSEIHQLVVTKSWDGPSDPHKEKDKESDLQKKR